MELARALGGAGSLGDGAARRAALRVVGQAFAGIKGLLAGGEDELLRAVATGQPTVLVHPLQTLLGSDAMTVEHRSAEWAVGPAADARRWGARPVGPGSGPGLIAEKIRAPSSPIPARFRAKIRAGPVPSGHASGTVPVDPCSGPGQAAS